MSDRDDVRRILKKIVAYSHEVLEPTQRLVVLRGPLYNIEFAFDDKGGLVSVRAVGGKKKE